MLVLGKSLRICWYNASTLGCSSLEMSALMTASRWGVTRWPDALSLATTSSNLIADCFRSILYKVCLQSVSLSSPRQQLPPNSLAGRAVAGGAARARRERLHLHHR